jgi:hypothetical protein
MRHRQPPLTLHSHVCARPRPPPPLPTPTCPTPLTPHPMQSMDDIERAVDDGVNAFKALCRDARTVPAGGATEIEIARQLQQWGRKVSGGCGYFFFAFFYFLRGWEGQRSSLRGCWEQWGRKVSGGSGYQREAGRRCGCICGPQGCISSPSCLPACASSSSPACLHMPPPPHLPACVCLLLLTCLPAYAASWPTCVPVCASSSPARG